MKPNWPVLLEPYHLVSKSLRGLCSEGPGRVNERQPRRMDLLAAPLEQCSTVCALERVLRQRCDARYSWQCLFLMYM